MLHLLEGQPNVNCNDAPQSIAETVSGLKRMHGGQRTCAKSQDTWLPF
jgi:hypothetical protein